MRNRAVRGMRLMGPYLATGRAPSPRASAASGMVTVLHDPPVGSATRFTWPLMTLAR